MHSVPTHRHTQNVPIDVDYRIFLLFQVFVYYRLIKSITGFIRVFAKKNVLSALDLLTMFKIYLRKTVF